MKYKKSFEIKGRIIRKSELISIIESILTQYSKEKDISTTIEAKFYDGTTISDSNVSIFEDKYFEKLLLKEIIVYIRVDYKNVVNIYIYRDSEYSSATIESDDNTVYNSVCNCVKENIDLMDRQKKIYLLSTNLWIYFGLILIIIAIQLSLLLSVQYIFKISVPSIFMYIVLALSTPICNYITKYVEKQFPINQFDFGENSINRYKKENSLVWKIVGYIILNIVIPVAVSCLTK